MGGPSPFLGEVCRIVWLLALFGFLGAFLSGLLGVGGAVILVPALLYFGPGLGIHRITSLSLAYVFFTGLVGFMVHRRAGRVDSRLVRWLGAGALLGALVGGWGQAFWPRPALEGLFALLAGFAGWSLLHPPERVRGSFSPAGGLGGGFVAGFFAAVAGVGGASLLIPFMIRLLGVPVRVAIGSALPMVSLIALAGMAGRAALTPWRLLPPVLLGALVGSPAGSALSARVPTAALRRIFAVLVLALSLLMAASAAGGGGRLGAEFPHPVRFGEALSWS